jgi:hypothetical protein
MGAGRRASRHRGEQRPGGGSEEGERGERMNGGGGDM